VAFWKFCWIVDRDMVLLFLEDEESEGWLGIMKGWWICGREVERKHIEKRRLGRFRRITRTKKEESGYGKEGLRPHLLHRGVQTG
jgi:hypothetical protein